jgi:ACS family glucarate transporter-like MFS transporter
MFVFGLIVKRSGSFEYALIFVAATALLAIVAYLPVVGAIKRLEAPETELFPVCFHNITPESSPR